MLEVECHENLIEGENYGFLGPNGAGKTTVMKMATNLWRPMEGTVKRYSLGMKQRLGIARAILCRPELVVLDEPTNGLDPAGMKQIRDLFRMLKEEYGMTFLISSHLLSEIESIADTIGIISHGKLLREISMRGISEMNTAYIELIVENKDVM